MAEFAPAFAYMVLHEGSYVLDPADPGGETRYGISRRAYPNLDIADLTILEAQAIYQRDYWDPHPYAQIRSQRVASKIFDMAVNMGSAEAHRLVQRSLTACGEPVLCDGIFGPITLAAVNAVDEGMMLEALVTRCTLYYHELALARPSNQRFLEGWLRRAAEVPSA